MAERGQRMMPPRPPKATPPEEGMRPAVKEEPKVTGKDPTEKYLEEVTTDHLKHLGSKETNYAYAGADERLLETFDSPNTTSDYMVDLVCPEFTSLCPKTGQPDFATIAIQYRPDKLCVETKSLKLYLFSFRNEGSFMETITNKIADDLNDLLEPRWIRVEGKFNPRGGIGLQVTVIHEKE